MIEGFAVIDPTTDPNRRGIYVVDLSGSTMRCLVVQLGQRMVLLPWFDSPADMYAQLAARQQLDRRFVADGVAEVPWPRKLELRYDWPLASETREP